MFEGRFIIGGIPMVHKLVLHFCDPQWRNIYSFMRTLSDACLNNVFVEAGSG